MAVTTILNFEPLSLDYHCFKVLAPDFEHVYLHYISKGYITLVIPGIVSIGYVHCQSKYTTIYHGSYVVNTLKVEIKTVKGNVKVEK